MLTTIVVHSWAKHYLAVHYDRQVGEMFDCFPLASRAHGGVKSPAPDPEADEVGMLSRELIHNPYDPGLSLAALDLDGLWTARGHTRHLHGTSARM